MTCPTRRTSPGSPRNGLHSSWDGPTVHIWRYQAPAVGSASAPPIRTFRIKRSDWPVWSKRSEYYAVRRGWLKTRSGNWERFGPPPHNGYFDPCHYGRYLTYTPHPRWPEYIPPRDAYTKKTGIWGGNGFIMPQRAPVPPVVIEYENGVKGAPQFAKLGGKSRKTKQIRSEGPRGFLFAVMLYNWRMVVDRYRA